MPALGWQCRGQLPLALRVLKSLSVAGSVGPEHSGFNAGCSDHPQPQQFNQNAGDPTLNTAIAATYILTVTLLIATPGPVVALIINTASTAGARKALLTALGTNLSSLALIALAAYIVITSAAISPVFMSAFGLLGCLFIGYLALDILSSPPAPELIACMNESSMHGGLWRGFILGISNPKDIIFFIAFFPQFMQITPSPKHSLLLLSLLWVVIDFAVLGAYIAITRKMISHISKRFISKFSGTALMLVALLGTIYNAHDLIRLL